MTFKLSTVVHGRYHAFDLVREMDRRGVSCRVFTNYPKSIASRFGIRPPMVRSFLWHGVSTRVLHWLDQRFGIGTPEAYTHAQFSRWANRRLKREPADVIHCFSGVAEEIFSDPAHASQLKILVRGSSHIAEQAQLLTEEERRCGVPIDKPSPWMIDRESREYELADTILVLSTFARRSFEARGIAPGKLVVMPLGAELTRFRPRHEIVEARIERIRSGARLRVLMTGSFSYRKGILDFVDMAREIGSECEFRFVGSVAPEASDLQREARPWTDFVPKQPQFSLSDQYAWADVFVFTTIEDGFAAVLNQANAAGLPMIATTNCGGPDLIIEGKNGWIVPIRAPGSFVERLRWCMEHRTELALMASETFHNFVPRDWREMAREFEAFCETQLATRAKPFTAA